MALYVVQHLLPCAYELGGEQEVHGMAARKTAKKATKRKAKKKATKRRAKK